jgi:hypothetical protein
VVFETDDQTDETDDALAIEQVTSKYSFLASWSSACGFRRATWRFTVSLTFAQLYRANGAELLFDAHA